MSAGPKRDGSPPKSNDDEDGPPEKTSAKRPSLSAMDDKTAADGREIAWTWQKGSAMRSALVRTAGNDCEIRDVYCAPYPNDRGRSASWAVSGLKGTCSISSRFLTVGGSQGWHGVVFTGYYHMVFTGNKWLKLEGWQNWLLLSRFVRSCLGPSSGARSATEALPDYPFSGLRCLRLKSLMLCTAVAFSFYSGKPRAENKKKNQCLADRATILLVRASASRMSWGVAGVFRAKIPSATGLSA